MTTFAREQPEDSAQAAFSWGQSRVEAEFNEWIESPDGRRVEDEAVRRARKLLSRGQRHYGMKAVFESIRFDWHVGLLGDGEFRLNNNHTSLMARRLMRVYPDLADFFEVRVLRGI